MLDENCDQKQAFEDVFDKEQTLKPETQKKIFLKYIMFNKLMCLWNKDINACYKRNHGFYLC